MSPFQRLLGLLLLATLPLTSSAQDTPWTSTDVGASTGTTQTNEERLTLSSTGADIWERTDAFRFVHQTLAGPIEVTAQVDAHEGPSPWAKAGLMLRAGTGDSAPFVDLVRTRDNGLEFQYRSAEGQLVQTAQAVRTETSLPIGLRLTREGTRVTASYRVGMEAPWSELPVLTLTLPDTLLAGLVVTAGEAGTQTGTATFVAAAAGPLVCEETAPEFTVSDQVAFASRALRVDVGGGVFSNACSGEVTYRVAEGPGQIREGAYIWTPDQPGTYAVTVEATNLGGTTAATFEVEVLAADRAVSPLSVEGKHIVNAEGETVILRGVAIADPADITARGGGPTTEEVMQRAVDEFGARVIRLTLHARSFLPDPEGYLVRHVDPAVQWARRTGVYIILDWHIVAGAGIEPPYTEWDTDTRRFWNMVAPRYANDPNVIYELFNEPAEPADWTTWTSFAQPWVDVVRSHADNLLLVSGYWFSSIIAPALDDPFEGDDLVYVAHVYPDQAGHENPNPEAVWEQNWGVVAEQFPVIVTEWGYDNRPGFHWSGGTEANYARPLQAYLERKGISWTVWCFDSQYGPRMFDANWNILGGNDFQGAFAKEWLLYHRDGGGGFPTVSTSELNFGVNVAGTPRTRSFDVINVGQAAVEVQATVDHDQFVLVAPTFSEPVAVAAGDTLTVEVEFRSQGGGTQQGLITVTHDGLGDPLQVTVRGLSRGTATSTEDDQQIPSSSGLGTPYPQPARDQVRIPYHLAEHADVQLVLYDLLGRSVHTLAAGPQAPGLYEVPLDLRPLAAGLYHVVLQIQGGPTHSQPVVRLP
ncbi:MAG: cellulase family glycosylhydrolase [Bacteroidota bacterium]